MKYVGYKNILACIIAFSFVYADTLKDTVKYAITNNPEVTATHKNLEAFRKYVDEEKAGYFPTLNIESYIEDRTTKRTPEGGATSKTKQKGSNTEIILEQMLYDGGFTSSRVGSAMHGYNAKKYQNNEILENITLDSIDAYMELQKNREILKLHEAKLKFHEEILEIERINAEENDTQMDRAKIEAKTHMAYTQHTDHKQKTLEALSNYKKVNVKEPDDLMCRPAINKKVIPQNLSEAIEASLIRNFQIQENVAKIKEQYEKINEQKSKFLPKLTFELTGILDNNLLEYKTDINTYSSKIILTYNLLNGGKDLSSYQREKLFLAESQKNLDAVTQSVEDEMKKAFTKYRNSIKKAQYLEKYITASKEIEKINIEQFQGGTSTNLDILNAKAEVINSKIDLIETEFDMYMSYYKIMLMLSNLTDSILTSQDQVCQEEKIEFEEIKYDKIDADESILDATVNDLSGEEELKDKELLPKEDITEETKSSIEDVQEKTDTTKTLLNGIMTDIYGINNNAKKEIELEEEKIEAPKKEERNTEFLKEFLNVSKEYYTISVMDTTNYKKAIELVRSNDYADKSLVFKHGRNLEITRIIYGIYPTYEEAAADMWRVVKIADDKKPIIVKVSSQQKLYKKYNIDYEIPDSSNNSAEKAKEHTETETKKLEE